MAAAHWVIFAEPEPGEWLADMTAASAGKSFSSSPAAEWSLARPGSAAVLGHLPIAPLLAAVVGGEQYLSCHGLLHAAGGIRVKAERTGGGAKVELEMQLSPEAQTSIVGVLGPGPGIGMRGLRQTEAAHASFAVDVTRATAALRAAECPELAWELEQVFAGMPMNPPPRARHAAGPARLRSPPGFRVDLFLGPAFAGIDDQ